MAVDTTLFDRVVVARRGASVRRYHTLPTVGYEDVGRHSWGVAVLVCILEPGCSAMLLKAALHHDMGEYCTGDIPATTKWASQGLATLAELEEDAYLHHHGFTTADDLGGYERVVLKWADMLDLLFFCVEQKALGNEGVRPMFNRGFCYCAKMASTLPKGWEIAQNLARCFGKDIIDDGRFIEKGDVTYEQVH